MQIYHYDPVSKQYTGTSDAKIDPLEFEKNGILRYLMPNCSTQIQPPETISGQDAFFIDGVWQVFERLPEPEQETPEPTFEEFKQALQEKINSIFKAEVDVIKNGVTQEEIDTFQTQEKEAIAYTLDSGASTPMITELALSRGIELSNLVSRILANAANYKQAMGIVMGKKHALEDRLEAALTVEDLQILDNDIFIS